MSKLLDLSEKVFNKLKVIKKAPIRGGRRGAYWWCECSCGTKCVQVLGTDLICGNTTSCGCKNSPSYWDWERKFKKKYGDYWFDLSKVVFKDLKSSFPIGCPLHGFRDVTAGEILRSRLKTGCKLCDEEAKFIKKARLLYGQTYDYNKVEYKDAGTEVVIGCPIHGPVAITPTKHLQTRNNNSGCKECNIERQRKNNKEIGIANRRSHNEYMKLVKDKWGEKYDLSQIKFVKGEERIKVICRIHGPWEPKAAVFLRGVGCKKCANDSMAIDLSDQRFGKLKVLRKASKNDLAHVKDLSEAGVYWWVQCMCGADPFTVIGTSLVRGIATQCQKCGTKQGGRLRRERTFEKVKDKEFNLLTILRDWGSDKQSRMKVLCRCRCGETVVAGLYKITSGHTSSCGCLERGQDNYHYFKENEVYANSECIFYIADIDKNILKIGITGQPEDRKKQGYYKKYLFKSPNFCRCEAWVIENYLLAETISGSLTENEISKLNLSKHVLRYGGVSEWRKKELYSEVWLRNRYSQILDEMNGSNWEELYLRKFSPYGYEL